MISIVADYQLQGGLVNEKYPDCRTDMGKRGHGDAVVSFEMRASYIHDIMTIASIEHLRIDILAFFLESAVLDYECIERYLQNVPEGRIRILVWAVVDRAEIELSPIVELLYKFLGRIELRYSNSDLEREDMWPFIITYDGERMSDRSLGFYGSPHANGEEQITSFYDRSEGKTDGKSLALQIIGSKGNGMSDFFEGLFARATKVTVRG